MQGKKWKFVTEGAILRITSAGFLLVLAAALAGKWYREVEISNLLLTPRGTGVHAVLRAGVQGPPLPSYDAPPGWATRVRSPGTRFLYSPLRGVHPFLPDVDTYDAASRTPGNRLLSVRVPLWPLVLLFGIVPMRRLSAWCRGRRDALQGHCRACGYDLRHSPHRCPECGRPVAGAPALAAA